jgi:hypothetical protein
MLDEWQLADLCETLAFLCPGDDTRPRVQQPKIESFFLETQQHDENLYSSANITTNESTVWQFCTAKLYYYWVKVR